MNKCCESFNTVNLYFSIMIQPNNVKVNHWEKKLDGLRVRNLLHILNLDKKQFFL